MRVLPHHCQVPCSRFVGMWKRLVFTYKTLTKWLKVIRIQPLNPAVSGKPLNRERLQMINIQGD